MAKANGKYKIERGIAPPKSVYTDWPFEKMKDGDSFLIPFADIQALRSAATHYKARSEGKFDYITRKTLNGYRCWRVAPRL